MNKWQEMKSFIDAKFDAGCMIVTRQELIKTLIGEGKYVNWTLDNYRRFLTKAGFLENTNYPGIYAIIKPIHERTLSYVKDKAYPHIKYLEKFRKKSWDEYDEYRKLIDTILDATCRKKEMEKLADLM